MDRYVYKVIQVKSPLQYIWLLNLTSEVEIILNKLEKEFEVELNAYMVNTEFIENVQILFSFCNSLDEFSRQFCDTFIFYYFLSRK